MKDRVKKMGKAYDLISESLNEMLKDLEENDGKNLRRETVSLKTSADKKIPAKNKFGDNRDRTKFFETNLRI